MSNMKVSRIDPTATDDTTRFSEKTKVAGWGKYTQKSFNAYKGLSELTRITTSWDRLPASSVKHTVSHDPASKWCEGRSKGNNYCHVFTDVEKYNVGNSTHFVHKGIENAGSGWNENVTIKDDNSPSPLRNDYSDADTSTIELSDSTWLNGGEKSTKQGEDRKHSCNDLTYDALACSLDDSEASGWGDRSANDRDCHDPIDDKKPSPNNLVKMNCEMAIHVQDKKVVEEDINPLSYPHNASESADTDTFNPLASKKTVDRREHQIEVQMSEPGGSLPAPPTTITDKEKSTPNPECRLWFRQNKFIHNALLASVDVTLALAVATAPDAHTDWKSLHTTFANKSQTCIFSVRDQLSKVCKESRPIAEYLRDIRSITDELATAGSPISNVEFIIKILSGLGPEYNPLTSAISARESPIS
ncbi:hypothetical protein AgCh_008384 [Apium graveolens]